VLFKGEIMKKILWAATLTCLAGCGSAVTMKAPEGISGAQAYPVERPKGSSSIGKQQWKVGDYEIKDVNRKGQKSKGGSVGGYSSSKTKGGFTFTVVAPDGGKAEFECETKSTEKGSALGGGMSLGWNWQSMKCTGDAGTVTVDPPENEGDPIGSIDASIGKLKMTALYELSNGKTQKKPAGYLFADADGKNVAAMDVNGQGVLHLGSEAQKENPPTVVGAGIAMLLFTEFVSQQSGKM